MKAENMWIITLSGDSQEDALAKLKEMTAEFERLTKVNVPVKRVYFRKNNNVVDCSRLADTIEYKKKQDEKKNKN